MKVVLKVLRNPKLIALLPLRENLRIVHQYILLAGSGLFDPAFYVRQCPELAPTKLNALRHYLATGAFTGRRPHPLFDSAWYLEQYPDVASAGANPLVHFLQNGWAEKRNPHPLFDTTYYLKQAGNVGNPLLHYLKHGNSSKAGNPHVLFDNRRYLERNQDVAKSGHNPLAHYLEIGWKEGRDPHALFHNNYYLERLPANTRKINPLLHFVLSGFKENRSPNALFDCVYYRKLYSDVAGEDSNPLVHYVLSGGPESRSPHPLFDPDYYDGALADYFDHGVKKRLSPHPLFDVSFYLSQDPALLSSSSDPVAHYLEVGAQRGLDPCELFDTSFYLESYPEVARSGKNPLAHYITEGVAAGYNPNPLFDTAFYLKQYPDVAASEQNPLVHYMETGAFEGRSPSPFFDSVFYLRQNPKLKRLRINPLAHYFVGEGVEEGRDPNPFFSTSSYLKDHPEAQELGINPLVHSLGLQVKSAAPMEAPAALPPAMPPIKLHLRSLAIAGQDNSRPAAIGTVICITHVSPIPPRAGNEYRINRLLRWLRTAGYDVIPVISPLPHDTISDSQLLDVAAEFGNAVLCLHNGDVRLCLGEEETRALSAHNGVIVTPYAERLGENEPLHSRALELLHTDRTFCPDVLIRLVSELCSLRQPCVALAEYIFMSRVLPVLTAETLKVIDTHDVFSSKQEKVLAYGVSDSLSLTEQEERARLARADLILAIQPEEQTELECLVSSRSRVITVGVDFPITQNAMIPEGRRILFVASENAMNTRGLHDFIHFAWPSVLKRVPDAELLVAGNVCNSVQSRFPRVDLLGPVDTIGHLYDQANVIINPALAGTGLKIKTLEALSFFRPVVTWPTGTEGLHPSLASLCTVATDWFEFHQRLVNILLDRRTEWFTQQERAMIEELFSASTVYASLEKELAAYFQPARFAAV